MLSRSTSRSSISDNLESCTMRPTPEPYKLFASKQAVHSDSPKVLMFAGLSAKERKDSEAGDNTTDYSRLGKFSLDLQSQHKQSTKYGQYTSGNSVKTKFIIKPRTSSDRKPCLLTYSQQRQKTRAEHGNVRIEPKVGDEAPEAMELTKTSQSDFSELMDEVVCNKVIDWDLSTPYNCPTKFKAETPGGFANTADKILRRVESTQLTEEVKANMEFHQQQHVTPRTSGVYLGESSNRFYQRSSLMGKSPSLEVNGGCTPTTIRAGMFRCNLRSVRPQLSEVPLETPINSKPSSSWVGGTKTNKSSGWKLDTIPDLDKILSSQPAFTRFVKNYSVQLSQT